MIIKTSIVFLIFSFSTLSAHEFICGDSGTKKILHFNSEGKVIWSLDKVNVKDVSMLANGNFLFCQQLRKGCSVTEVTPEKKTVWEYSSKGELKSCQRLKNGNTVIANSTTGEVLEITKDGKIAVKFKIESDNSRDHTRIRRVRKGSDGRYYVAQHGEGLAKVYNEKGECLQEIIHLQNTSEVGKTIKKNFCFSATPLANGEVLLTGLSEMKIVNKKGETIWKVTPADIPEIKVFFFAGAHALSNGNIVVCNWLGHGNYGKGTPIVEISRDKKVVWKFTDNKTTKSIVSVQVIEKNP